MCQTFLTNILQVIYLCVYNIVMVLFCTTKEIEVMDYIKQIVDDVRMQHPEASPVEVAARLEQAGFAKEWVAQVVGTQTTGPIVVK